MKCLVIMDAIESIKTVKDTSFAMMLEAQRRGWSLHVCGINSFAVSDKKVHVRTREVSGVRDQESDYVDLNDFSAVPVDSFDMVWMRKDPPVDMQYMYVTQLLELAGVNVVNRASSLRDVNEKLFALSFPECCPVTLVTPCIPQLNAFLDEHKDIVCKPLDGMGGESVFSLNANDVNRNVVFETLTAHGSRMMLAQRYIPEIMTEGDKRILMIDGEPVSHGLARMPRAGEFRGNLAAGGSGHVVELTDREREVCSIVGPVLREKGLRFVGLDMIGGFLIEINVTSPTCAREITNGSDVDVCKILLDALES